MNTTKQLFAIVGPTAIGKTSLSILLAKHFESEIFSADSRQFYKEMAIGTAVPEPEELALVKHHFIQHRSIHQNYSVGDYEQECIAQLDSYYQKKDIGVLVGGSGMYVDAVVNGLDVFPYIAPEIRLELNNEFKTKGIQVLQERLKILDPQYASQVDLQNSQRVIRALEICIGSGKPFSSFLKKHTTKRVFYTKYIGLDAPREIIYKRINTRVDQMIENGLLEEAKTLYPHRHLNALNTVGYKELFKFLDGSWELDFAISEIKKNTRRFAKRQLTWYRKNPNIHWVPYNRAFEDAIKVLIHLK